MKKILSAFVVLATSASSAQAEDILSIIERQANVTRPVPPAQNPYNYTLDVILSGKEGKDVTAPFSAKLLINPSAAPEERVTIVSTSEEDYPDEFEQLLKETRDVEKSAEDLAEEFWCEGEDDGLFDDEDMSAEAFTVLFETETEAVIKPNLKFMAEIMMDSEESDDMSKSERKMMKKMMERLDGEFIISKPDLTLKSMKMWLTRPLTMAVVAKLKEMEVSQSCAIAPNGFAYTDTMTMHVKAKALGMTMVQDMDLKVSGLTLR